jgi:hypothetical protein
VEVTISLVATFWSLDGRGDSLGEEAAATGSAIADESGDSAETQFQGGAERIREEQAPVECGTRAAEGFPDLPGRESFGKADDMIDLDLGLPEGGEVFPRADGDAAFRISGSKSADRRQSHAGVAQGIGRAD